MSEHFPPKGDSVTRGNVIGGRVTGVVRSPRKVTGCAQLAFERDELAAAVGRPTA
jgi:hypothetical protein